MTDKTMTLHDQVAGLRAFQKSGDCARTRSAGAC